MTERKQIKLMLDVELFERLKLEASKIGRPLSCYLKKILNEQVTADEYFRFNGRPRAKESVPLE